uniref:Uncharacterized protein n=1 Tax=Rhizophagus irregularis (strain DAOM 181602 / DAOM 197198 / MUCL 43194) TaxID=747089 RepID=U9UEI6_RHIID
MGPDYITGDIWQIFTESSDNLAFVVKSANFNFGQFNFGQNYENPGLTKNQVLAWVNFERKFAGPNSDPGLGQVLILDILSDLFNIYEIN